MYLICNFFLNAETFFHTFLLYCLIKLLDCDQATYIILICLNYPVILGHVLVRF